MKRLSWLLPALLFVWGCPLLPPVPPPNPPVDTNLCEEMCSYLQKLGCEEGAPVYNNDLPGPVGEPNQSCADNCRELQNKGFFVNPRCVILAPSCSDIEEFRQKQPEQCTAPTP